MSDAREDGSGFVGRRVRRAEDTALVSGAAEFCGDVQLPGMLDVAFHRTDRPHARVVSVDTAEASSIPGVREVLTQAELGGLGDLTARLAPPGHDIYSTPRPLLARDVVRYVGEPVAVAVASSRYSAEDACDAVVVEYQDLPVVGTVEEATIAGGTILHEAAASNVLFDNFFESDEVDQAFEAAYLVIERTFHISRLAPAPIEARGIVAAPTPDGLRIWYSTQTPYVLRRVLTELLELSDTEVRVTCPHVGGGFGQKSHVYPEDVLVPWLAIRLGQPVRWLEDRSENLIASCHARGQTVTLRASVTEGAEVTAFDANVTVDVGAYGIYPHGQLLEALGTPIMITGPYRIPALRFRSRAVATNKCPGGGYRGVGLASAVYVHERMMDIVASEFALDPAEVRRRNLITEEEMPKANPVGLVYDSGDYPAALEAALRTIGAEELSAAQEEARSRAKLVGLGLSCYTEYTGMGSNVFQERGMLAIAGHEEARITIEADGRALVRPTVPTTGQGSSTAYAQLVADELCLDISDVEVRRPDTSAGPDGSGSFGSRGTVVGGTAVLRASSTLRARLLELASHRLEVGVFDLILINGGVQPRGVPAKRVAFAELAALADEGFLDVLERHDPLDTTYAYGVHACLVEVDPKLGSVRIIRYIIVDDCGRIINPMIVEGQAHGSTAQGIGAALLEGVVFDPSGQPLTGSLVDYLLPGATDVPNFTVLHHEHRPIASLGGFKGVGEGGTVAAPPAVANAIANAIGEEFNSIPVTPELIFTSSKST